MKKTRKSFSCKLIVAGLVAISLLASCKKNKHNVIEGQGFSAKTENDGGRTYLDGTAVKWTANDLISVANLSGGSGSELLTYQLTEGENSTDGTFYTGEDHAEFFQPDYVAAYPANQVTDISNNVVTFDIPATQTYVANSFGAGAMPMVAYSSDQTLQFKNVFGGICFPLVGEEDGVVVSRIVLTSKTDEPLWGTCTTTVSTTGDAPSSILTNTAGNKNTVTLDCGDGITLSSSSPTDFYILVPPGSLAGGFTVEVWDDSDLDASNKLYSQTTSSAPGADFIARSVVKKVENNIEVAKLIPGEFWAEFTVNINPHRMVRIAKGNLWYLGNADGTGTWRFAEHQWDMLGDGPHSGTSYQGNTEIPGVEYYNLHMRTHRPDTIPAMLTSARDLFKWGTSGYHNPDDIYNTHYQPYMTCSEEGENIHSTNGYGYGPSTNFDGGNLTGLNANYDWGVYNSIENGGNQPGLWRVWTQAEGACLLNNRTTANGYAATITQINPANNKEETVSNVRFVKARVANVNGLIIFADRYVHPEGIYLKNINKGNVTWPNNDISEEDWKKIEDGGAVFLPATCVVVGTGWDNIYSGLTRYSTSIKYNYQQCEEIEFSNTSMSWTTEHRRHHSRPVRLVRDVE